MQNNYYITLVAGTRVMGLSRFDSIAESQSHEKHVGELKTELREKFISYDINTGFIIARLTEADAIELLKDYRVLRVSLISNISLCPISGFSSKSAAGLWHLGLLSNKEYSKATIACGFNFSITTKRYGFYPIDYYDLNEIICLNSETNKIYHNGQLYNIEYNFGESSSIALIDLSSVSFNYTAGLEVGLNYLVYHIPSRLFTLANSITSDTIAMATLELSINTNSALLYYANSDGKFEISNLKLIVDKAVYNTAADGSGVEIIIGDAHIDYSLAEFGGRASLLFNPYSLIFNTAYYGELDSGFASHGTLVACAAAGSTYGIANGAKILGVTLFDYSEGENPDGSSVNPSDKVLDGLHLIGDYVSSKKALGNNSPTVVSLSIKMSTTIPEVDDLIKAMINDGATVVIAAGNDNIINNHSPYSDTAILVAACDVDIKPTSFTEYGERVSVYAPGKDIKGLRNGGIEFTWSGTSVACPLVAGLCAIYLSICPNATPSDVVDSLLSNSLPMITYNRLYTTSLVAQSIDFGIYKQKELHTSKLKSDIIYTVVPYYTNFDNSNSYGDKLELTLDNISNVVISAGHIESIDIGTIFQLQR